MPLGAGSLLLLHQQHVRCDIASCGLWHGRCMHPLSCHLSLLSSLSFPLSLPHNQPHNPTSQKPKNTTMRLHSLHPKLRKPHHLHHSHRPNTATTSFIPNYTCINHLIPSSSSSSSSPHLSRLQHLGLIMPSPNRRPKPHRLSTCSTSSSSSSSSSSSAPLNARPYRIRRLLSYRYRRMNHHNSNKDRVHRGSASAESVSRSVSGSDSTLHSALSPSSSTFELDLDLDLPHLPKNPKHEELVMLKREAFQELASQTQRSDDLFIAKMIYWESLGNEEKAQWLERGQGCNTDVLLRQQQGSVQDMERDEVDELVDALECQATCKDYSALLAFERQAEIERRQQGGGRQVDQDQQQDSLNGWEAGY
ncbi:hypothetical protein EDD21DRAFT_392806 [Dissophora ornata]|nr:hypothetical protein EDD21DRAFT_392806 [Dissophora ornata]